MEKKKYENEEGGVVLEEDLDEALDPVIETGQKNEETYTPEERIAELRKEIAAAEKNSDEEELVRLENALRSAEIEQEKIDEYVDYEVAHSQISGYIEPLKKKVKELTIAVKEVEDTDENEYNKRLEQLRKRETLLANVTKFETKLWGNNPKEHISSVKELHTEIRNVKNPDDVLSFFDRWGALPGANRVDRPIADKEKVKEFFDAASNLEPEEYHEAVKQMFANIELQKAVQKFVPILPRESAPEVADVDSIEGIKEVQNDKEKKPRVWNRAIKEEALERANRLSEDGYQEKMRSSREAIAQAEQKRNEPEVLRYEAEVHAAEQGLYTVRSEIEEAVRNIAEQENALIEAKDIISSKTFRYAPFLMKFTKKGREQLALLKTAGLDKRVVGASGGNLELARALRLKAVKEKYAVMQNEVDRAFADNLERRKLSEEKERATAQIMPDDRTEYNEDQKNLKQKNTRKKSEKNFKTGLKKLSK